jgi:hypothetical protein
MRKTTQIIKILILILACITINTDKVAGINFTKTNKQFPLLDNWGIISNNSSLNYTLIFKISGMKNPEDAKTIDDILMKTSFIISSSTDFETGKCKVVTDKLENKGSIIEIICYKAAHKIGVKLTAELLETIVEKE